MNFRFFAFGMSLLFAMVIVVMMLTMIGSQFLTKDQLSLIIEPIFFIGFIVIGYFIYQRALPNKYIHSTILCLILIAFIGIFLDVIKQVPTNLWKFLLFSFALLQVGVFIKLIMLKIKK